MHVALRTAGSSSTRSTCWPIGARSLGAMHVVERLPARRSTLMGSACGSRSSNARPQGRAGRKYYKIAPQTLAGDLVQMEPLFPWLGAYERCIRGVSAKRELWQVISPLFFEAGHRNPIR